MERKDVEYARNPAPKPRLAPQVTSLRRDLLDLRRRSLVRANALVLISLAAALLLSDFPNNRRTLFLILPAFTAIAGTVDTIRCIQRRWSFYHAGVVLCIYMDLMILGIIFFFLLYPYLDWLTLGH